MPKRAKTVAKELNIPVKRVLELSGKPDGSELSLVDPDIVRAAAAEQSSNGTRAKKASARRRQPKPESHLLHLSKRRGKGQQDEDNLYWCQQVVDANRRLFRGPPFRPEYFPAGRTQVRYRDPLEEFLEPGERNSGSDNFIRIGLEELNLYEANSDQHFRWRSNELLTKFERKLSQLWLANTHCRFCGEDLAQGFRDTVKQILSEKLYLPDTPGQPRNKIMKFPSAHEWCVDIRERIRDLTVELQHSQGGDERSTALRVGLYRDFMEQVHDKYRDDGVDYSTIVAAFRGNLRVISGAAERAGGR